ncbi:hypothetical protein TrispH2_004984 [Trichoplax sp. H2]|nr:hypothetical protein TrispH2_004984 [Trichoplax sp. H2]|eukprot:RDD43537.1 hypothetical protein TrispH2_004984 [Trichoplax sp. H2]
MNLGILPQLITDEILRGRPHNGTRVHRLRTIYLQFNQLFHKLIHFIRPRECSDKVAKEVMASLEAKRCSLQQKMKSQFRSFQQKTLMAFLEGIVRDIKGILMIAD